MAIAECIEPVPPNIVSYEAKTPEPSPSLNPTRFLTVGYAPPARPLRGSLHAATWNQNRSTLAPIANTREVVAASGL